MNGFTIGGVKTSAAQCLGGLSLWLLTPNLWAQSNSAPTGAYLWQTVLGLAVVLAAIFAIAWVVKRLGRGGFVGNSRMNVLSVLPLGQRERVVLIEVGDQQLLVGVTAQSVNLLTEFATPVISKEERAQSEFSKKIIEIMRKGPVR